MVAGLVVALFFALVVLERIGLLGMLKAVGASTRQLAVGLVTQAVLVALGAFVLGGAISLALAAIVPAEVPVELEAGRAIITGVGVLATALIGSAVSFRRIVRIDPASAVGGVDMPALEMNDIRKVYGSGDQSVVALDHATLTVADDEMVALVGPSGSGKTTLLSIVGGLLQPTAGTVRVGPHEIDDYGPKELTRFRREFVGFVFQGANLVPFLSARENLLIVSELAGVDRKHARRRADQLLDELGLSTGPGTRRPRSRAVRNSASRSAAR